MRLVISIIVLLMVLCFGLAAHMDSVQSTEREQSGQAESFLALLLGEGRALFANEFFAKADAYFHRGRYPSIFETAQRNQDRHLFGNEAKDHLNEQDHAGHDHHDGEAHAHDQAHSHDDDDDHGQDHDHSDSDCSHCREEASQSKHQGDWIERFGAQFRTVEHAHLEHGDEREMLPWLKLAADMDPKNVDAYTVAAYWLRERLGKTDEAERFLREGLEKNPRDPELLNELARLMFESRKDMNRARNLWLMALQRWTEIEQPKETPDKILAGQIIGGLYRVELEERNLSKAIQYLELLQKYSPNSEAIQHKIDELRAALSTTEP